MSYEVIQRIRIVINNQFIKLDLSLCDLKVLPDELEKINWLEELQLEYNPKLNDLSLLAQLGNLTTLHFPNTQVSNLSPLYLTA